MIFITQARQIFRLPKISVWIPLDLYALFLHLQSPLLGDVARQLIIVEFFFSNWLVGYNIDLVNFYQHLKIK